MEILRMTADGDVDDDGDVSDKWVFCALISVPFCCILFEAASLKCHHCTSTKSWEDCERVFNQSTAECTQEDSVCFSVHYRKGGSSQYERSCGLKSYCEKEANPVCSDEDGSSECDIRCCDDDMCNAGSVVGVSVLLITVRVFAAIFMVKPWDTDSRLSIFLRD